MDTGTLGSSASLLGDLLLGGTAALGDVVAVTAGLALLYRCDDGSGQAALREQFGRDATVNLGTVAYLGDQEGIDDFSIQAPTAGVMPDSPPFTKNAASHLSFDYTGGTLALGNACTIEIWFRPHEFGDEGRTDGGVVTPQLDYEFFRLENPGVSKISFRAGTDGTNNGAYRLRAAFSQSGWDGTDASLLFGTFAEGLGNAFLAPSVPPCEVDRWYYLAFAWDQTSTILYTNGAQAFSWPSNSPAAGQNTNNVHFGGCGGNYDLVAATARKLSAAEIASRWAGGQLAPITTTSARLTNLNLDYAATYNANARVTKLFTEVLRTGARNAWVTSFRAEVLRTVDTATVDNGVAGDTLTFTGTATAGVGTGHSVAVSQTLVFTQGASRSETGSITQSLAFTETVTALHVHGAIQTLAFTQTVAVPMIRNRAALQLLAFTETTTEGHTANLGYGQLLVLSDAAVIGRAISRAFLQLLVFNDTAAILRVRSASDTDTLVFSDAASGVSVPPKYGRAGDTLVFNDSDGWEIPGHIHGSDDWTFTETILVAQMHNPRVTDTLVFFETVGRGPDVRALVASDTLVFYDGYYPKTLPILVGGLPVVLNLPVGNIARVYPTVILQSASQAIVLPSPEFGDSEGSYDRVNVKRSMSGVFYTYVQTSTTRTLKYQFILGRSKAMELRLFMKANLSAVIRLTNWKGQTYVGQFTSNPFSLSTDARYVGAYERVSVGFEFEGVKL